jgi:NADH-quinone oxidoreductase subunit N
MLSLAGLPPLAGIFAKIYVFLAAIGAHSPMLTVAAVLGVLASCVAAYYYLKIAKIMYFDEPVRPLDAGLGGRGMAAILAVSTAFSIFLVFLPAPLVNLAGTAAQALFR